MSNQRVRRMTPDRLKRHHAGIRKLDEAFGLAGAPTRRRDSNWKRDLLGILGLGPAGYDTKANR